MPSPRTAFLVVGACFGLFFALATPPHDPPDEARHHARAWLISTGRLGVVGRAPGHAASVPKRIVRLHPQGHHWSDAQLEGGAIPKNSPRTGPHDPHELPRLLSGSLGRWDLTPVLFTSAYAPVVYAPYVPALWLANALDLSAAAGLLLARLFGLAAWLAGIVATLGVAPSGRWLIVGVALLPISVAQGAAVSGDGMTQVALCWWLAECLRAAARGPTSAGTAVAPRGRAAPGAADAARLVAAAFALGVVKPGYAPLALAALALPFGRGARLALTAACLAAAALPTLGWAALASAADPQPLFPGADLAGQLRHMLHDPAVFLRAVAGTTAALLPAWLEGMVGNLGHFDVEIPAAATALGLGAAALAATLEERPPRGPARLWLPAAFLATGLAVLAMAYLGWSPVGSDRVQGVQGRYFLPMLPFALAALPAAPAGARRPLALLTLAALVAVLAITGVRMVQSYYAF